MSATKKFAGFAAGLSWRKLPAAARQSARRAILDTVGVMLAGAADPGSRIVLDLAGRRGGPGEASAAGRTAKTDIISAALANGFAAHVLDLDDCSDDMTGHPSVCILPAVIAAGERVKADGKRVITAYAAGFETAAGLGRALPPSHYESGWHNTSTIGTMGAAAAASRMLGLDAARTAAALGIAASFASGVRRNFGTLAKPLHAGHAAASGLFAADLAGRGLTAAPDILEADCGFHAVFGGGPVRRLDRAAARLGRHFSLVRPGVQQKLYPSCSCTHPAIQAALALREEARIDPARIRKVSCGVIAAVPRILIYPSPSTGAQARFSMEYCAARALCDGKVGIEDFDGPRLRQGRVRRMMRRIRTFVHPEGRGRTIEDGEFVELTVTLDDGTRLLRRVGEPLGHPKRPLTAAQIEAKYLDCARRALSRRDAGASLELASGLDRLSSIERLAKYLRRARAR